MKKARWFVHSPRMMGECPHCGGQIVASINAELESRKRPVLVAAIFQLGRDFMTMKAKKYEAEEG